MMKKRTALLFTFLAALIFWTPCSLQAAVFRDVSDSAWYAGAVNYCYEKSYFEGMTKTEFGPKVSMNRAMLVTVLYRHAGSPAVSGGSELTDVPSDTWYTDAVIWGEEQRIVAGYEDGTFRPGKAVSRQEIMAFSGVMPRFREKMSPFPETTAFSILFRIKIPSVIGPRIRYAGVPRWDWSVVLAARSVPAIPQPGRRLPV